MSGGKWCGPCRQAAPVRSRAAARRAGAALVLKVDTEQLPDLARQFGVRSIPNFVVVKRGSVVRQAAGLVGHAVMERWLADAAD